MAGTAVLNNKKGSQMVEAAISLPVIILTAMLMIRLFVFYLEILTAGIEEHRKALEAQDAYNGALIRTYEAEKSVDILSGGILQRGVSKRIEVKAYLVNEDFLVRSGEIVE
ncbi:MAG: hypothetical protein E7227_05925 [Clostridiales bacterium]|nr:hypothetical protein [Clostridiales bacterium]